MMSKVDIFRKLPDGRLLWIKAVVGIEEAKSQIRQLSRLNPGDYFIFDPLKGNRIETPPAA